jgi:hypothetical protein
MRTSGEPFFGDIQIEWHKQGTATVSKATLRGTKTWNTILKALAKKPMVSVGYTKNQKRYILFVRLG